MSYRTGRAGRPRRSRWSITHATARPTATISHVVLEGGQERNATRTATAVPTPSVSWGQATCRIGPAAHTNPGMITTPAAASEIKLDPLDAVVADGAESMATSPLKHKKLNVRSASGPVPRRRANRAGSMSPRLRHVTSMSTQRPPKMPEMAMKNSPCHAPAGLKTCGAENVQEFGGFGSAHHWYCTQAPAAAAKAAITQAGTFEAATGSTCRPRRIADDVRTGSRRASPNDPERKAGQVFCPGGQSSTLHIATSIPAPLSATVMAASVARRVTLWRCAFVAAPVKGLIS